MNGQNNEVRVGNRGHQTYTKPQYSQPRPILPPQSVQVQVQVPPPQSVQVPLRGSTALPPSQQKPIVPPSQAAFRSDVADDKKSVKNDIINYLNSPNIAADTKAVLSGMFFLGSKMEHQTRVMDELCNHISNLTQIIEETSGKGN